MISSSKQDLKDDSRNRQVVVIQKWQLTRVQFFSTSKKERDRWRGRFFCYFLNKMKLRIFAISKHKQTCHKLKTKYTNMFSGH